MRNPIEILIVVIVCGVAVFLVNNFAPMDARWKNAFNALAGLFFLVYLLQLLLGTRFFH